MAVKLGEWHSYDQAHGEWEYHVDLTPLDTEELFSIVIYDKEGRRMPLLEVMAREPLKVHVRASYSPYKPETVT
jgi:hypothetical protein